MGMNPTAARPPAAAIMFCSAMPNCRKRSGWLLRKWRTPVPPAMSASRTTSLGNSSARPDSALPNASRSESPLVPMSAGASDAIEELLDLLARRAERGERFVGLLVGELDAAVPGGLVFHVRNALALDGVGDDDARAALRGAGAAKGLQHRCDIVAVDLGDRPIEGAPLCRQRLEPHDLVVARVAL